MQGKESEKTFGLNRINFGARTFNPTTGRFDRTDPLGDKYTNLSLYNYVANNPIGAIDPDGQLIIFVNGHWNSIANKIGMSPGGPNEAYWNFFDKGFTGSVKNFYKDNKYLYLDGSSRMGFDQSGGDRFRRGQKWARKNYESVMGGLANGETIKLVGHSEGSAYAAGIANYFIKKAKKDGKESVVESILHLSPDEADEFDNPKGPITYRIHDVLDPVSPAFYYLSGIDYEMITGGYNKVGFGEISRAHGSTVSGKSINRLKNVLYEFAQDPNVQTITNADGSTTYKRTGQ